MGETAQVANGTDEEAQVAGGEGDVAPGVLLLVDVLGAKQIHERDVVDFLGRWDPLCKDALHAAESFFSSDGHKAEMATFGDTILLHCHIQGPYAALLWAGYLASRLTILGLRSGIPLRGAVAFGKYLASGSKVLGPAVSDAASWYAAADWLGVMLTPKTGLLWDSIVTRRAARKAAAEETEEARTIRRKAVREAMWIVWTEWEVPLSAADRSHSPAVRAWAAGWPFLYEAMAHIPPDGDARADLLGLLSECHVPLGTEGKYANTVRFFDGCRDQHPYLISEPRPFPPVGE